MSENKIEKGYVEVKEKEKAPDSVIKKNISNINNENFNHQTKSEIWTWKEYSDLSGHLEAPNGQNFFEYDWTTKEYKLNENSEWSHFDDGSNSYDTSFNAFKEYAQNFIVENIQDDKPVKIIWKEEKKLSYEEKFELGNELLNIFEHNSLSMDNNDKYDALELINKGADLTESLRYVSNDANMYENCHWLIQNLTEEQIKEYFSNKEFADELYERAKDSVTNDKESWQDVSDIGISGFIEIAKLCNREEEANKYYKELLLENIDLKDVSKIREKTIKEYMEKLEHYDKKDKINFVLERLKAAGIEVVTDKKEFDKILEREKLLQKKAIDFSEFEKLEESINNQKSSNLHLQDEKLDLESQKKILQQKNHAKFVEVVKQLEKYIPTNEYMDTTKSVSFYSKVLINSTKLSDRGSNNIFLIKVNNPGQNDIFVVRQDPKLYWVEILGKLNDFEKLSQFERVQTLFNDTVIIENFTENLKSYMQQQLVIEQQKQNKLINEVNSSMQKLKEMDIKNSDILSDFVQLDKSLRFNSNFEIESSSLNEMVSVFPGSTGKSGLGIRHIIEERYKKDNLSQDEITALSALILETVKTGDLTRDSKNRCEITKNGIIAIIRKDFDDRNENWILTGFQYKGEKEEKNREATEAIQTVIAQYSHSLEYSYFRNQVGAVISSLDLNISQSSKKSSLQSIVQNGNIYGFAYEGKIYLNPDVMNSEAAVHEYAHLWDKYTQETNPELWEKGLNLFKGTSIWNEVINDKNYADIKDDENLVLSECHSRIVGKIADKVLQKVLERDGVITQKAMLDWDTEVINYIYENFKDVYEKSKNVVDIADFMAMPIKDLIREEKITHRNELSSVSNKFDQELKDYIDGKLDKNHIFNLGLPGEILKNVGFPENSRIEMSASRLEMKSKLTRHPFDFSDIYGLTKALNEPVAVFEYGDKNKSENVVVNIEKNGKNFLAGIHFNQNKRGYEVSDLRTIYPKDNIEWLNWINQGKMIYGDKEKLQALVAQQRMNGAEVNNQVIQSPLYKHCLESVDSIMQNFTDVKDIYTKNYPFYEDVKKAALIEQKFYAHYVEKGNLDAREISHNEAKEFYTALVNLDTKKIDEYTKTDLHEISEVANRIKIDYFAKKADIVSENNISYMPERNVINTARAARAAYCLPVLKGEKKGLWKAFKDFKRHGVFDIQGHSISTDKDGHITDNGFKQLATAMDIYRDKRFESARYVFLDKDGNIKDQLALSTFMPNHSISKLDETFEQVVKYAQASNTRVAFVHNHPSGNIEASVDDKRFTKNLEEYLNRNGKDLFAGHIILDHNTFNCFKPGNDWQPVSFDTTEKDRFEKENVPEFTKTKIDSVDNLLSVAKSINDTNEYNKNWIPVVFSRTDASIGGIEYFSKDYFIQNKSEDIQKDLQNIGLLCGSNRAIPVIPKELSYDEKLHSEVINKFRDGCFYDFALGNRTAKDFNLENMSAELFNYTVKEMQTNTMVESTFELPKVDKKEIGVSSKVAENTNYYKKENIQPVDLSSYIDKSKSTEVFEHDFMLNKKFVPPFVFADNNCYIRCNAKDLKINSALKLNPEKKVDVIVTKAQFAKIISDEKLKEKILKLKEYKKTKKPITPLEVASAKMSTEQEELILAQDPHLNFTDRKLTYNAMYKEIMTDVSKLDKEKAENAITLIKQSDKEFEQIKKDFIQTNGNFSKATKNQNEAIDY